MKTNYVLNPLFVLALVALLLNDFYFKTTFSNALTGKLSDLAGIVVLALFLTTLFPKQKLPVYILVALGFAFWKSPFSEALLTYMNTQFHAGYARVVDYTDLSCLLVLVPLYRFEPKSVQKKALARLAFLPLSALTLFAVVATSRAQPEQYGYVYVGKEIILESNKQHFLDVLTAHNINYKVTSRYEYKGDSVELYLLEKFLMNSDTIYSASLSLKELDPNKVSVNVHNIYFAERVQPVDRVNYANQDSIVNRYKTRAIQYFESFK